MSGLTDLPSGTLKWRNARGCFPSHGQAFLLRRGLADRGIQLPNRNDAAVVATGVGGAVVFREGEFRDGYGETVQSGRYLRAGERHAVTRRPAVSGV